MALSHRAIANGSGTTSIIHHSKVFLVPQPEELPEEVDFELEELSAELARPFNVDESPATTTIVMMLTKTSLSKKFKLPSSPPTRIIVMGISKESTMRG